MNDNAPNAPPDNPPDQPPGHDLSVYRRLVNDKRISPGAFRLWHYLRDRQNKSGKCWPQQRTIALDLGCKTHSLRAWTDSLVSAGYLATEKIGQNHHLRYTVLCGDGKGDMPEWATRRNAQTGDTSPPSCRPNSHPAKPPGATPRPAQMGDGSNPNEVIKPSKVSTSEMILHQKELDRVEKAISDIKNSYDHYQPWTAEHREQIEPLKTRRKELKRLLGFIV